MKQIRGRHIQDTRPSVDTDTQKMPSPAMLAFVTYTYEITLPHTAEESSHHNDHQENRISQVMKTG
jgi:hypothetical protein